MSRPKKKIEEPIIEDVQEVVLESKPETSMSTKVISVGFAESKVVSEKNTVSFKVDYSNDFKGEKFYKQYSIREISLESALLFEKQGIGKILK